MPDDPIWQVADKIWDMLEAHSGFAAVVPSANRVKYTDTINRNPDLDVPAYADYPRVSIKLDDIEPWAFRTSNGSSMTLHFRIDVHVGDRRLHMISDVITEIYYAFTNWRSYLRDQSWDGETFNVTCVRLEREAQDAIVMDRATTGWLTVYRAKVDIWQRTAAISGT